MSEVTEAPALPPAEECSRCRFWGQVMRSVSSGACRRYPPETLPGGRVEFPTTRGTDWCGEFRGTAEALREWLGAAAMRPGEIMAGPPEVPGVAWFNEAQTSVIAAIERAGESIAEAIRGIDVEIGPKEGDPIDPAEKLDATAAERDPLPAPGKVVPVDPGDGLPDDAFDGRDKGRGRRGRPPGRKV